ncbi:hypothetical protein [Streptomyces purpureus]|uniref:Uncharacterized protein n=1 Tax=Streptomyces purpureus TaxID=1951 RepID=A0A918H058_9ACTN|nr:hypothetical protein GCM10014713_12570 [Streptomyces purpureus]
MSRQRGRGRGTAAVARVSAVVCAALCAVALPGQAWAAGESPYEFDGEAKPVKGAVSNSDAQSLAAGSVYKDTIAKDGKLYYRVDLDDRTNAYVSVVAVPKPGGRAEYGDGIEVSLQDGSGTECGSEDARFESAGYTRPLAAYAHRTIEPGETDCQKQGAYYVLVERTSKAISTADDWQLEIRHVAEPALKAAGPTDAPDSWPSSSPPPPAGGPQKRTGGTSFHTATGLTQGEWRDDIKPGQTLFYRVPVRWGQQIYATASLGSSSAGSKYIGNALVLTLTNPAHGHVDQKTASYDGRPSQMSLDPKPPVAYENRFDSSDEVSAMRFAGWYYLSATLSPELAQSYGDKPVPLTLRINVDGKAEAPPAYDGPAGIFQVTDDDQDAAASGQSGPGAARSDSMKLIAASGIGAGTVLVLGLGGWMLLARRRAGAAAPQSGSQQYGPPAGW